LQSEVANRTLEIAMQLFIDRSEAPSAIRTDIGAIFVSMELGRSTWLITSLSPGGSGKMSKHGMPAGNLGALVARFAELQRKAFARASVSFPIVAIQEAGLDGFWIHRLLQGEGIESHVVDPASIAISRRRRRAKTGMRLGDTALYHAGKAAVAASRGLRDGFPRAPALAVFVAPDRAAFCKVWPPLRAFLRGGAPTLVCRAFPRCIGAGDRRLTRQHYHVPIVT
jgi:hypothetical protein